MSETGAFIQQFNLELVKCVESLKTRLSEMNSKITEEELIKAEIESKIVELNDHLEIVNKSLNDKYKKRDACRKTIADAEEGLSKIADSAKVLLDNVISTKEDIL